MVIPILVNNDIRYAGSRTAGFRGVGYS